MERGVSGVESTLVGVMGVLLFTSVIRVLSNMRQEPDKMQYSTMDQRQRARLCGLKKKQ